MRGVHTPGVAPAGSSRVAACWASFCCASAYSSRPHLQTNCAQRMRLAAYEQSEADKVRRSGAASACLASWLPRCSAAAVLACSPTAAPRCCYRAHLQPSVEARCKLQAPSLPRPPPASFLQVRIVKAAEADAEAKYLAGQGIARQRQVRPSQILTAGCPHCSACCGMASHASAGRARCCSCVLCSFLAYSSALCVTGLCC